MKTSLSVLRILLGFTFLWAFFDKLVGLGFSTIPSKAWTMGISPTAGFLKGATYGPLKSFFVSLAGVSLVDWLFMLGLLLIGLGLIFNIAKKLSTWGGSLMLLLMWASMFPPKTNPFIDDHIIYIAALLVLYYENEQKWSLNKWWNKTSLVKSFPILS